MFSFLIGVPIVSADNGLRNTIGSVFGVSTKYIGGSGDDAFINNPETRIYLLIGQVIQIILSLLTVFFFVLIIYGGFLWMTAAGNDDQVAKARKLIIRGISGFVLVLLGLGITFLILSVIEAQLIIL